MLKQIVVAIDGPAGAGKSTVARAIAAKLGFVYIDSGAMYRAVAWLALQRGLPLNDQEAIGQLAEAVPITLTRDDPPRVFIDGQDITEQIRTPAISQAASAVSTIPAVRRALVFHQRQLAAHCSVVMEGRDIGTVVFPQATVKIYLDADAPVRAARRVGQLQQQQVPASVQVVTAEMRERDARDRQRAESPLLQAPDAVYLDSTGLSQEEVEREMLRIIRERTANGKDVSR